MIAIKNAVLVMRDHLIPDGVLLMENGIIRSFGEMRKQKIPKINLKAMLTEHNVKWDSVTLHDELAREHEAVNKK